MFARSQRAEDDGARGARAADELYDDLNFRVIEDTLKISAEAFRRQAAEL